jgi:FAD-dependent urate hydroxylase
MTSLDALEHRLREDLRWLELPPASWVPPRFVDSERVLDVAIIGGGMAGLTASAELRWLGIGNHQVFDRAPDGDEGRGSPMRAWKRCARRRRSPGRRCACRR